MYGFFFFRVLRKLLEPGPPVTGAGVAVAAARVVTGGGAEGRGWQAYPPGNGALLALLHSEDSRALGQSQKEMYWACMARFW